MNNYGYPYGFVPPFDTSGSGGSGTSGSFFPYGITVGAEAKFADGTATAPSITFSSAPTTGIYQPGGTSGTSSVGISVESTETMEIKPGQVDFPSGSATSPGLSFLQDSSSGIYYNPTLGTQSVGVSIQGSEGLDVSAAVTSSRKRFRTDPGTVDLPGYAFNTRADTGFWLADTTGTLCTSYQGSKVADINNVYHNFYQPLTIPSGSSTTPALSVGGVGSATCIYSGTNGLTFTDTGASIFSLGLGGSDAILTKSLRVDHGSASAPGLTFNGGSPAGLFFDTTDNSVSVSAITGSATTKFDSFLTSFIQPISVPGSTDYTTAPSIDFAGAGPWISVNSPTSLGVSLGSNKTATTPFLTTTTTDATWGGMSMLSKNYIKFITNTTTTVTVPIGNNTRIFGLTADFPVGTFLTSTGFDARVMKSDIKGTGTVGAFISPLRDPSYFRVTASLVLKVAATSLPVTFMIGNMTAAGVGNNLFSCLSVGAQNQVAASTSVTPVTLTSIIQANTIATYPYVAIAMISDPSAAWSFDLISADLTYEYLGAI